MENLYLHAFLTGLSVIMAIIGIDLLRSKESSLIKSLVLGSQQDTAWKQIAETVGPYLSTLIPLYNMDQLKQRLITAGQPYGLTPESFIGVKFIAFMVGFTAGLFFIPINLPPFFIIITTVLAYIIPDNILKTTAEKRQKTIYRELPNMIGLLATAVGAGVELGPALEAISRKFLGPLGNELRLAWRETATGKPRAVALRHMAKRTGVTDVERFIETIVTAEERGGVDISTAINLYKKDLLESQSRKIYEEAKKIPTKMLLPMFLCIFIPTLIVILVPVGINLFEVL